MPANPGHGEYEWLEGLLGLGDGFGANRGHYGGL